MRALAALLLIGFLLAPAAPARAEGDPGPMRLGLPGLWDTILVPEKRGAPLRLGLYAEHGVIDDGHGFDDPGFLPDITSQQLRLQLGLQLSKGVLFSATLPWRRWSIAGGTSVPPASATGLGDLQASVAVHLASFAGGRLRTGLWGSMRMPTGDPDKGLTTNKTEGEYGLVNTWILFKDHLVPETRLTVNVGYRINKSDVKGYGMLAPDYASPDSTGVWPPLYPRLRQGEKGDANDHLLLRAGLEVRRRWAHLFLEYAVDWLAWDDGSSYKESASWLTPGLYLGKEGGPALKLAWSIGLWTDDAGTGYVPRLPGYVFSAGVSYPIFLGGRDRDGDGIPDGRDACVDEPEDLDGFQDEDGCPDRDNDRDGIEDRYDAAPNLPEDMDGFEDFDGRPDLDNDGDGIEDAVDACPDQPEDFDGFEDEDGCPDVVLDRDGDGIEDKNDVCPDQPEDFDGFEDQDGCPDLDNDLDGVPDAVDQCPDQPEDYDGDRDDDGCPDPEPGPAAPGGSGG